MSKKLTLHEAAQVMVRELNYPEEKAYAYAQQFDKNNDGQLSASEITAFTSIIDETKKNLVPNFKKYDRDGNGFISLKEAADVLQVAPYNFPSEKVVVLLKTFDKDGNGKLDIEEFAAFYADAKAFNQNISERFDKLDKDKNGVLSPAEVVGVIMETLPGCDEKNARHMVRMFDQNKDGNLDKEEFMQMWTSLFG